MASRKRLHRSLPHDVVMDGHARKRELVPSVRPTCPSVPFKMRKSAVRPFEINHARPIFHKQPTSLSQLYKKTDENTYVDQVFECLTKIGEGSFGCVYKAKSRDDHKFYAIKISKNDRNTLNERYGEVRRLEKIPVHVNCVRYYVAWEEAEKLYIQFELCMNSLDQYAHMNHNITEEEMWDILVDLLEGLKNLHDLQLVHLDIKPANIMITEAGIYKLADFGLLLDLNELNDKNLRSIALNLSDGDAKYLASEILSGKYTKACDIFSLGISMLELATDLVLPSNGPLWHQLRSGVYPSTFEDTSIQLRIVIEQMMSTEYTDRPNVDELLETGIIKKIRAEREKGNRVNHIEIWKAKNPQIFESDDDEDVPACRAVADAPTPPLGACFNVDPPTPALPASCPTKEFVVKPQSARALMKNFTETFKNMDSVCPKVITSDNEDPGDTPR